MAEKTENNKVAQTDRKYNVLLFLASVLSPWLILLYFYTHNPAPPSGMATLTIASVSMGYIAAWLISAKLFRSTITATFLCFFATIHLWVGYRVFEFLPQGNHNFLIAVKLIVFLVITVLFVIVGNKLQSKLSTVTPVILTVAIAILIMNLLALLPFAQQGSHAEKLSASAKALYESKEYKIDKTLPSPNIYWIHCDGMLGFSSVEKYFGDDQTEFKQSLADRDFAINEDAYFEALHRTGVAVNVLMNPAWYDKALQEEVEYGVPVLQKSTGDLNAFLSARWPALRFGSNNNEMVKAFSQKEYTVTTAQTEGVQVFPITVQYAYIGAYKYEDNWDANRPLVNDFSGVFSNVLYIISNALQDALIPMAEEIPSVEAKPTRDNIVLRQLADDAEHINGQGHLSIAFSMGAHVPFIYDENGDTIEGDSSALNNYMGTHRYAAKTTLQMVDMILETDPDAIIVLQADHGPNLLSVADIHEQLGADAVPEEIWNQVLSAVRVPERYQNEDFHYAMEDPRNISRWLINSFVGEQYEYLT